MTDNNDNTPPHTRIHDILLLPPLPAIACKLLALVGNDECDIDELTALIEQDPGLAARIIGIANSAYFARATEICSVHDAIVRVLGLNLVRGIAIGVALSKPLDPAACPDFQLDRFWYRAMQTAALTRLLEPLAKLPEHDLSCLFLCGLLHHLGQLVLVHAFPDRMSQVFRSWAEKPETGLLALESRYLAMTEIEAGTVIAQRWQLPTPVADVIEFRHDPWRAGAATPLVEMVIYCAHFAAALYDDPDSPRAPVGTAGMALAGTDETRVERIFEQVRAQDEQMRALAQTLANTH